MESTINKEKVAFFEKIIKEAYDDTEGEEIRIFNLIYSSQIKFNITEHSYSFPDLQEQAQAFHNFLASINQLSTENIEYLERFYKCKYMKYDTNIDNNKNSKR